MVAAVSQPPAYHPRQPAPSMFSIYQPGGLKSVPFQPGSNGTELSDLHSKLARNALNSFG